MLRCRFPVNRHASRFALAVLVFLPFALRAQSSTDATELIQKLMEKVQQLEKRVAELERERAPVAPPPPLPAAAPAAAVATPEQPLPGVIEEQVYPRFRMAGFSDVNFGGSTQPESHSGFAEGQFVLHINSQLSPKVSFFSELSMSARPYNMGIGGTDPQGEAGYIAEVERSFIRYDYNDYWKASFGRFHTPINYWNNTFHHGTWLQTTVSRPEMARSFIPIHFIGAMSEGSIPVRGVNVSYNAGVGNGRGPTLDRAGDFSDVNNNRAWLVNVSVRPDKLYPLQVGASVYRDLISVPGNPVREWFTGAHVVWHKENPELIAEFANAQHRVVGSPNSSRSQSWYVQTAYRLGESHWKPYYRFEQQHVPKADVTFRPFVPSLVSSVAGIRWDISTFAAFKFEYRNIDRPVTGRVHYGFIQTSFTF